MIYCGLFLFGGLSETDKQNQLEKNAEEQPSEKPDSTISDPPKSSPSSVSLHAVGTNGNRSVVNLDDDQINANDFVVTDLQSDSKCADDTDYQKSHERFEYQNTNTRSWLIIFGLTPAIIFYIDKIFYFLPLHLAKNGFGYI